MRRSLKFVLGVTGSFLLRICDMNGKIVFFKKSDTLSIFLLQTLTEGRNIVNIQTDAAIWNKPLVIRKRNNKSCHFFLDI